MLSLKFIVNFLYSNLDYNSASYLLSLFKFNTNLGMKLELKLNSTIMLTLRMTLKCFILFKCFIMNQSVTGVKWPLQTASDSDHWRWGV